eukprot:TRINITY_DN6713_c0_g2_i3.p2 TRINITY_DN6713_c0_g2~~TRINITY_DN6713_c0_g2_i3.p2  ORF type:complete len:231 (-),score=-17.35 TRINITY_DN6713_c0_g2_i3:297-989(-)
MKSILLVCNNNTTNNNNNNLLIIFNFYFLVAIILYQFKYIIINYKNKFIDFYQLLFKIFAYTLSNQQKNQYLKDYLWHLFKVPHTQCFFQFCKVQFEHSYNILYESRLFFVLQKCFDSLVFHEYLLLSIFKSTFTKSYAIFSQFVLLLQIYVYFFAIIGVSFIFSTQNVQLSARLSDKFMVSILMEIIRFNQLNQLCNTQLCTHNKNFAKYFCFTCYHVFSMFLQSCKQF